MRYRLLIYIALNLSVISGCSYSKVDTVEEKKETPQVEGDDLLLNDIMSMRFKVEKFGQQEIVIASKSKSVEIVSPSSQQPGPSSSAPPQSKLKESESYDYYVAQKGDTLMWISFKLFGKYGRWRQLERWNQDTIKDKNQLEGLILKYIPDSRKKFEYPNGHVYLIQKDDYLGLISKKIYETAKYWKFLWHYNKHMIKSPDLIFAGFTLYYLDKDEVKKNYRNLQ